MDIMTSTDLGYGSSQAQGKSTFPRDAEGLEIYKGWDCPDIFRAESSPCREGEKEQRRKGGEGESQREEGSRCEKGTGQIQSPAIKT